MKNPITLFGVAGNPPNFWNSKFSKERANAPQWLNSIGLDALEIQCTYGVRMPEERAKLFRENSKKYNISLSIHAPYYISLGSDDSEKRSRSVDELKKAVNLSKVVGSKKVIFHPGGVIDTRDLALKRAVDTLRKVGDEVDMREILLYPETAGKVGQLGSLEDIITLCKSVTYARPCLDLAHLHARTHGTLRKKDDFAQVLTKVRNDLGEEALSDMHIHLYPVDYGPRGEKVHKAFDDKILPSAQISMIGQASEEDCFYRPRYEPFIELIIEEKLTPTIICEAKDSQDVGAKLMKEYYEELISK